MPDNQRAIKIDKSKDNKKPPVKKPDGNRVGSNSGRKSIGGENKEKK